MSYIRILKCTAPFPASVCRAFIGRKDVNLWLVRFINRACTMKVNMNRSSATSA